MPAPDVSTLAQLITQLGLLTSQQMRSCLEDFAAQGEATADPESLLRFLERRGLLTGLQIEKLRKGDRDGYMLGGYRLLYKIASGSFGRVYRADDPQTGRVVAIKVLRRRWSDDPVNVELFEREGRVGMSLRHDNIVEILSVGRDPATKQYFIVMEFVEGGNLRDLLAIRKKFSSGEALKFLEEMAAALAAAYSRGVTHRDIKLTNILISAQGMAKLVDFGLARTYASLKGGTEDDIHVQRTVDYAGLEKATSVPSGDIRSDIYFLGTVAYEMLTGRPPLPPTRDKYARMHRSRFENVPPIRQDEIDGPPSVIRLVETMMSLNPRLRYQTPAHLLEAIRKVRTEVDGGVEAVPAKAPPTIFVVERDHGLQNPIRDRLKKLGYRVLVAGDPMRAVDRFTQQPFEGLVVDVGTTEEEGLRVFNFLLQQAKHKGVSVAGVLILSETQAKLADLVDPHVAAAVLQRPLSLARLMAKVAELVPLNSTASHADVPPASV